MNTSSPIDDLNSCEYLFLHSISEPEANSLNLVLSEGIVSECTETLVIGDTAIPDTRAIEVTEASLYFEVAWDYYISYAVRNESYCNWDKTEQWTGNAFRVYSKSKFLDFVREGTFATADYPGPFVHYEIVCSDHIIDVASEQPPTVRLISG